MLLDSVALSDSDLPVVRVRLALERGRLLNSSGDPTAATDHFREAYELRGSAGEDFLEVDAAHMLAIADQDRADDWTAKALRTVDRARDPRTQRWAGSLHNNAGWARHDAGDYAGALAEFEAALAAYSVARHRRAGAGRPVGGRPGAALAGQVRRGAGDPATAGRARARRRLRRGGTDRTAAGHRRTRRGAPRARRGRGGTARLGQLVRRVRIRAARAAAADRAQRLIGSSATA